MIAGQKSNTRGLAIAVFCFALTLMAAALVNVNGVFGFKDTRLQASDVTPLTEGWQMEHAGTWTPVDMTGKLSVTQTMGLVRLRVRLDENLPYAFAICMQNENLSMRVRLGGTPVYEEGYGETMPYGTFLGRHCTTIPLPDGSAGKELTLELCANRGALAQVVAGQLDASYLYILRSSPETIRNIV